MRESKKLGLITDHGKLILERGTCTFWNIKLVMKQPCWMLDRWSSPVQCWSSTLSHGNSDIYERNLLSGHVNNNNLFVPVEHLLNYSITEVAYKQWLRHCSYQLGHIVSTIFMSIWWQNSPRYAFQFTSDTSSLFMVKDPSFSTSHFTSVGDGAYWGILKESIFSSSMSPWI